MSGGGPAPSSISGLPEGAPPSSELSTFPVRSVLRALARVTVGPAPGTERPIAPLPAYRSTGNGSTTRTAATAGAATTSARTSNASGRATDGVSPTRTGGVGSAA